MVCLGVKPEAAEWKAQMNPLSYDGTSFVFNIVTRPQVIVDFFRSLWKIECTRMLCMNVVHQTL